MSPWLPNGSSSSRCVPAELSARSSHWPNPPGSYWKANLLEMQTVRLLRHRAEKSRRGMQTTCHRWPQCCADAGRGHDSAEWNLGSDLVWKVRGSVWRRRRCQSGHGHLWVHTADPTCSGSVKSPLSHKMIHNDASGCIDQTLIITVHNYRGHILSAHCLPMAFTCILEISNPNKSVQ